MSIDTLETAFRSVDPLGEALHSLHMSGTFYSRSELTAPWGIDLPAMPECLMFHVVTKGRCWIEFPNGETQVLNSGDFALIPHGQGHTIVDNPESKAINIFELEREQISPRYELLRHGGGGELARIICGAVAVKDPAAQRVVSLLPKIIVMQTNTPENDWLLGTIRMMMNEAETLKPGGDTIITRVSDILVVQAIRHWLEKEPLAKTGWLGALHDEQIGKAIARIHRQPTHPWSVEALASQVGMSRSSFAKRFMDMVGQSPMQYVRQWRFQVAEGWLRETERPLAEIAEKLSYESEASFNRSFKKFTGRTPGSLRRQARTASEVER
ncbi:AraC family transcriptional regulator [Coraliomargarita sp. SDUM461003]|uniref:AraC family transcriptional regulator n=1 Tax=Thalassobacterium maritimum TaxID=3041265 RepID=A0ABU1AY85_9BACT|nr:AraC family transcriptional regulator [Coraliomargarita sp. SDUM461003]MDQ8209111.1 AraC family transcriptional regulator [Coraliomargarita sp. SDUM461003]